MTCCQVAVRRPGWPKRRADFATRNQARTLPHAIRLKEGRTLPHEHRRSSRLCHGDSVDMFVAVKNSRVSAPWQFPRKSLERYREDQHGLQGFGTTSWHSQGCKASTESYVHALYCPTIRSIDGSSPELVAAYLDIHSAAYRLWVTYASQCSNIDIRKKEQEHRPHLRN